MGKTPNQPSSAKEKVFFDMQVVKNIKSGGELAFGLASLTAITYPIVSTYQGMIALQAAVTEQGKAIAQQGMAIAQQGMAIAQQGMAIAEQGKVIASLAVSMAKVEKWIEEQPHQ